MKTNLLMILLVSLFGTAICQNSFEYCAHDAYMSQKSTDISFLTQKNIYEQLIYQYQLTHPNEAKSVLIIPVVFHIIHNGGSENIPDSRAQQTITDLNEAFSNTGYYASSLGVNTEIQFCLAKQSPSHTFTTGINRVVSPLTDMTMETQDAALKALSYWDARYYLNIWVVKSINSLSSGAGVAGYANFPSAHGAPTDGIVVEAPAVGSNKEMSKVVIHEAGHYLGLYHTFQEGCSNSDCLLNGDRVCDTPPDNSNIDLPCSTPQNSCSSDADDVSTNNPFRPIGMGGLGDQNDLKTNFMDYGNVTCFNAFTNGQMVRMRYALTHDRASLGTSIACNSLCLSPTNASFQTIDTIVPSGTTITFTNTSSGATSYTWSVNGVFFSSSTNPSYTFTSSGTYIISLQASTGDTACTTYFYDTITVRCSFQTLISSSMTSGSLNSTVTFTATAIGATNIQWYLDGVLMGTGISINHTFTSVGGYYVYAIANDGTCYDTSVALFISIGTCNNNNNYNTWYFGFRGGIDFNSGVPVATGASSGNLFEGDASLCYNNGRIMMYAGVNTVFDSTNNPMPNSAGLLGSTTSSSTQGMLFVKKPMSDSLYYVFTTDEEGGSRGLRYSEINMKLRGGLGDVTSTKNILLYTPTCEKLFAIKHCNGRKIWILSHEWNSNRFIVYKIDGFGVDTTKIISAVGSTHTGASVFSHGQLVASPDGKRIAVACQQGFVELFDFDNNTGLLSNPVRLTVSQAYGVAFSPNGKILYAVGITFGTPDIWQYDLTAGSTAAIIASATSVGAAPGGTHGSFQLFKDGKIYHSNGYQTALSVINNPNTLGAGCNYVPNALALTPGRECRLGLNNIPVIFSSSIKPAMVGLDTICTHTIAQYDVVACTDSSRFTIIGDAQIESFDDNSVRISGVSSGMNYLVVKLMSECGIDFDTLPFYVKAGPRSILPSDTTLCTSPIVLASGADANSYLWNTGATSASINVSSSGTYWVRKTDSSGCITRDTIQVSNYTPSPLELGNDTFICPNELVHISAGNSYQSYRWQDGLDLPTYSAYHEGLYYLTVKDVCNNSYTDSIRIYQLSPPNSILTVDTCITLGSSICLYANYIQQYQWSNGDSNASICITPTDSILVWVNGTDSLGCIYGDTIQICVIDMNSESPIIPNAFSPNSDGLNDYFMLVNSAKFNIDGFTIWNRWGNIVYDYASNNLGWDGKINHKEQPIGSYVYYIEARNKSTEKAYKLTGTVQLIR